MLDFTIPKERGGVKPRPYVFIVLNKSVGDGSPVPKYGRRNATPTQSVRYANT